MEVGKSKRNGIYIFGIILFMFGCDVRAADPVKDEKLYLLFQDHQITFVRLLTLVLRDSDRDSFFSFDHIDQNMEKSRQNEYRKLFLEISKDARVTVDYDHTVKFTISHSENLLAIGPDWLKGIEYTPRATAEGVSVNNLDSINMNSNNIYVRKIKPNWYMFFQISRG